MPGKNGSRSQFINKANIFAFLGAGCFGKVTNSNYSLFALSRRCRKKRSISFRQLVCVAGIKTIKQHVNGILPNESRSANETSNDDRF